MQVPGWSPGISPQDPRGSEGISPSSPGDLTSELVPRTFTAYSAGQAKPRDCSTEKRDSTPAVPFRESHNGTALQFMALA